MPIKASAQFSQYNSLCMIDFSAKEVKLLHVILQNKGLNLNFY